MLKCSRPYLLSALLGSSALLSGLASTAQDNSPYSRYGLGDLVPPTNIATRGMGSISAAYADINSINFNNPASYSQFLVYKEAQAKKISSGRVLLDVGLNFDNRTLVAPNTSNRFTSSDAFFSYLQLGLPLKKNWGLSFGLRPVSRISYSINRNESLKDPLTGNTISNAVTQFKGSGGSYLPTIGTGFGFNLSSHQSGNTRVTNFISFGANGGYLFGSRENSTLRSLIDSAVLNYSSDYKTTTSFGDLFFNAGMQYSIERITGDRNTTIRFGLAGNWKQDIKASQDVLRQTFTLGSAGEELQIDSVFAQNDIKGQIVYPGNYKAGVLVQHFSKDNGWVLGVDYSQGKWSQYRYFGQTDLVKDNWTVNVGAQLFPKAASNYFSRVVYRAGFYTGEDYVFVNSKLPVYGASFGMGLPIAGRGVARNQFSILNLAFEYGKRGNNDNLLKENIFRISAGFSFSDVWFGKKKYE